MAEAEGADGRWRIGELSRRVGVSDHVLRAWERRYALLDPVRSPGGFRLYSAADEERVRRMQDLLADGMSPAEAARVALSGAAPSVGAGPSVGPAATVPRPRDAGERVAPAEPQVDDGPQPGDPGRVGAVPTGAGGAHLAGDLADSYQRLGGALERLDEPAAQQVLDDLLSRVTVETALRQVVLPYLHELGERWASGQASVAQEHFASQVVRGRLSALARGWGRGVGPRVLLACPPGERHELALLTFGVVLARRGWAVTYLGADTPAESMQDVADRTQPALVVLASSTREGFTGVAEAVRGLAGQVPVALAGAGAGADVAADLGARLLESDPVTAALSLDETDLRPDDEAPHA